MNRQFWNYVEVSGVGGEDSEVAVQCGGCNLQIVCSDVVTLGTQVRPYLSIDTSHIQVKSDNGNCLQDLLDVTSTTVASPMCCVSTVYAMEQLRGGYSGQIDDLVTEVGCQG